MPVNTGGIEGRVAAILNSRELVINVGSHHGVQPAMKFAVLAENALVIKDPSNGTVLGTVDREKVRVQAHDVRDIFTICRTYRMVAGATPYRSNFSMRELFKNAEHETMRISEDSTPPPLSDEESYVKVNDRVIRVEDG